MKSLWDKGSANMSINLGVKALLGWVNSIKLSDREITIDDLQDGTVLLRVVHMLKKEPSLYFSNSTEDRFKLIADFVEISQAYVEFSCPSKRQPTCPFALSGDCRFSASKGTSFSWDNIRDGINLTVEIAKVLLLLVYHDIMNDRCTLNTLDCDVEREIANLTASFVMESEGCVYLSNGLDAYLARKHLPVPREIFERSATSSTSNVSTVSSFSDDESPLFRRTQKITFVDMQTVASSSVSKSPLQDIMNTPKFQMRKMQRQMVKERDYRDGLERELASKLALIAQRESHINQLQYRLDKLKEEQGDQEQIIREQINELETKNNNLQMRLDEMLKQNKDFKSTSSLMERKVDELTEENGVLSSQMRAVCSQLAIFEAEVGRLTEAQTSAHEEWRCKTANLESELSQATAQKELLTEQIQILQGKISCLEDEISRATNEEVGENMGPVMEREMFESEINCLKNELESTVCSLKKAEVEIQVKTQQLAEYEEEISQQNNLLKQQKSQTEEILQAKDEILDKLQKEITEQRAVLQQEIQDLKLKLAEVEQQKTEQMMKLQQHIAACEQEVEKLKEIKKAKEDLLYQTEEKVNDLETKLSAASSFLADKDQQINGLRVEVDILTDETNKNKNEIQAKEEMLAKLLLEKSNEEEILYSKIQTLTVQVEDLSSALKLAEQEIRLKQDLLTKTQQENIQQREVLQQQITTCEEEVQKLNEEIQVKNEQLVVLKNDSSRQSDLLEQEIKGLRGQLQSLNDSLRKAEEQVLTQELMLTKQEQESAHQSKLLQQQLSTFEERVKSMGEEIQTKEEQMNMLKNLSSEQSKQLNQEIHDLKKQVETLSSSLTNAEDDLQSKENRFAEQQLQSTQEMEALQAQIVASQDDVKKLTGEICAKEEQLIQLKTDTSTHSELLQQEIERLNEQIKSVSSSLEFAENQVQAKEELVAKQEQESSLQIEALGKQNSVLEEEVNRLREEIQTKLGEMELLKIESCKESEVLQNEIQSLKDQVHSSSESLKTTAEQVQAQESLLTQKEMEISQEKDRFQNMMTTSEEEIRGLREQIQAKEELLVTLKEEGSMHSDMLQQEIKCLKSQLADMDVSLSKAEEKIQAQLAELTKQEKESGDQRELLQQQLSASEEEVKKMREEIQAKEEQMILLKTDSSEQSEQLNQEIQDLKKQVDTLGSSLRNAEKNLQSKENQFAEQQLQSTQEMEALQAQIVASQDDVKKLTGEICAKEEQLIQLKTDTSTHSELLQQEIEHLNEQIKSVSSSLEFAENQVQAKEELVAKQEQESSLQIEALGKQNSVLEEEVNRLREEIQTKLGEMELLKIESCKESEVLQNEIQSLKDQVQSSSESLKTTAEQVQAQESLLTQKEIEISQEKDRFQNMMTTSEEEIRGLREQIQAKEELLVTLKEEGSMHSDMLQQEIKCLKTQLADMDVSLSKAEEKIQAQLTELTKQEKESGDQRELLQQQLSASEEEVKKMREEIQAKEQQMMLLKTDSSEQSEQLNQEIQDLKKQVDTLGSSLRNAEKNLRSKEELLAQQQQENTQQREVLQSLQEKVKQVEILQKQIFSHEEEIQKLKESQIGKESLLLRADEKLQILQTELSALNTVIANKDQNLNTLKEEVAAQAHLVQKAKEEAEANEKMLSEKKEESSRQTNALQFEIQNLKEKVETISLNLLAKEQMLLKTQQESAQQIDLLQQQLDLVNAETQAAQKLQVATSREKEALVEEKEALVSRILQVEKDKSALEKKLEAIVLEKERIAQAKQATERENIASRKLESVLKQELEILKTETEKLLKEREKAVEIEALKRDLQEQLSAKSEAAEHYKAQMEKAVSHYNGKKQLLQESQEEVAELKRSLEVKEREISAITMENKMLQLDLDKAQNNEKKLVNTVASLETQLAFADRNLRAQNKIHGKEGSATESCNFEVPNPHSRVHTRAQVKRTMSSDSLDQSSLEDSLNTTRKLSAPDESSTPLVRSSERLAAKRRGLHAESLETLYFTPINNRQVNRTSPEHRMELDSARKNPTSSVKRRRTTQVINITMTKKTPGGGGEGDETFYSLASARSHPNLSSAHTARPVSMELFDTPAKMTSTASDQLIGLPGYRRSTIHSQPTSTFCVGAENEPDGAPEDWMRIAELQARNKACLPHLKSSYPVECDTGRGSAFVFTDEELRMGDPSDTIRRASTMPGQLQDSLASHRLSLMMGHSGAAANTRSSRLSLMPGQLPSKVVSASQLRSPKASKQSLSTLSVHQTSPEKKVKASCFPRPLTPKNKNVMSGPSSSHLQPALSQAERRQSMMFTIDNTPTNKNYLKKGLNKLRSSTRKSPGKTSKKSPAQTSARKCQENILSGNPHSRVAQAGRTGSFKSPQVVTKGQRKSPRGSSRTAKSPGLTASARKVKKKNTDRSIHGTCTVTPSFGPFSIFRQENYNRDEDDEEAKKKWKRPPSSYGSMKSDSDGTEEEEEEEERLEEESADTVPLPIPVDPGSSAHKETGLQLNRSESPETLYSMTTEQTKPPGAVVIETGSEDLGDLLVDDNEEDMDEILVTHSPEPPEPVELDDWMQTDEYGQPGRLHPEQDLPHIFKSIQNSLSGLTNEELLKFKMRFLQWEPGITLKQLMEGDLLDFVDRILEVLALTRFHLKQHLIRKHQIIREGVVRAGKQNLLDTIYVEPQISTCGHGGVDPSHEFRPHPPSPLQVPSADTFIGLNNLFQLQTADGRPVRTVVTTGLPGIGMSVSVGKFCLDWAELRANKDLQFVIKLSFRTFWHLRNRNPPSSQMSIMEVIEYNHPKCKDMEYLEEEDCKFLIIMDSFDCYQACLDWEHAPVINDNYTQAHPDVLIVNIIRGTVLRGARVWILGRRAAVSQIPPQFIDAVTEIQGFSDEMKDDYLNKRFSDAELTSKIVAHYKRLPTLHMLARHPFVCWMVATMFERCFRYQGYGVHPPRLTPFYISILIVQINRRLQFYYGKADNELKWSSDDTHLLTKMAKMAFKMLERNTSVFFEEDVKECGLKLTEVTVFSGLCSELPTAASDGRRRFCFIHFTFQEFMAALYVFTMFRSESKNILESGGLHMPKILTKKGQTKSAAGLVQCALERTFSSPLGHYDMFLRFLCGILSPDCHNNQLSGYLYRHNAPKLGGLDEVQRLLEHTIQSAQENHRDRVENLKECLREMTQEDE
ncbi:hypothetical protein L3Q82_018890 [Scortum barcoo]|uniref:Uncharacterized protein n=1 Tax=Scortum barcoo TaxID=214431 RepID=A0ACB8VHK2_9TELE|nr:hypothetical protein L3Q82_018890 [Scortum barcoo]